MSYIGKYCLNIKQNNGDKKMTIAKYLKENERWFDVLDFLTMAQELKKFHNVDTDTKEIGEVFDSLYS